MRTHTPSTPRASHPLRRSASTLALACVAVLAIAPPAGAIIVSGGVGMPAPDNGFVGWWHGSSGVCVGEYWVLSAKHVGGGPGDGFLINNQWYSAVETVEHPIYDFMLVRVNRPLPGWHRLGANAAAGDPVILGGYGVVNGDTLPNTGGYKWSDTQAPVWGANTLSTEGRVLAVNFSRPGSGEEAPFEATFAVHDSGAGLFVVGPDNALELVGTAVSVSEWGQAPWGSAAFCLNVDMARNWIMPIIAPDQPISSGVLAPRAMLALPALPGFAGGVVLIASLATLRRRR